jgi:hypothetical protein
MGAQDQVNLPATSTDLGTSDFGVLQAHLHKVEVPIDVQPIDPVCESGGTCVPGTNNDWGQSQGNVQVLALSTPAVDVCAIVPFDGNTPSGFLSVANSEFVPFTSVSAYLVNNRCIGLRFQFDRAAINATIEGTTASAKQATCAALPVAVLIIRDAVELQTTYTLAPEQPRKASYEPDPQCTRDGTTVTCNVSAPVIGTQAIKCSVPAGG